MLRNWQVSGKLFEGCCIPEEWRMYTKERREEIGQQLQLITPPNLAELRLTIDEEPLCASVVETRQAID